MLLPLRLKRNGDVSLFTREWIEILCRSCQLLLICSLPLYEGVD